eukprot:6856146-Prymnesium_polylepis.1
MATRPPLVQHNHVRTGDTNDAGPRPTHMLLPPSLARRLSLDMRRDLRYCAISHTHPIAQSVEQPTPTHGLPLGPLTQHTLTSRTPLQRMHQILWDGAEEREEVIPRGDAWDTRGMGEVPPEPPNPSAMHDGDGDAVSREQEPPPIRLRCCPSP